MTRMNAAARASAHGNAEHASNLHAAHVTVCAARGTWFLRNTHIHASVDLDCAHARL